MRRLILLLCLAVSGIAHSDVEAKREALQALIKTYSADDGNIENLLKLNNAVEDAVIKQALSGLEHLALPVWGDGDIIIYEFSDYQCGYCRYMFPSIDRAVDNGEVQVRLIEFPILSDLSHQAALYALAAQQQGKYIEFHRYLMSSGQLDEDILASAIAHAQLDTAQAEKYINSPAADEQLQLNYQLALLLNINVTPAFIINNKLYKGAFKADDFKQLLQAQ